MKLSILITLLNEELVLPQTHREISNQLEKMLDHELTDYELLYICSREQTGKIYSV